MPSPLPFLTRLFLGIPGALLWIAGGVCSGVLGFSAFAKSAAPDLLELRNLGFAVSALSLGYLMVAADGILSRASHYRIAGEQVPALVGMELGVQLAAVFSLCSTVGGLGRLGGGDALTILPYFIAGSLGIWGTTRLYQRLEDSIERWEDEYEVLQNPGLPEQAPAP
jgi:hypothetical protein